MKSMLADAGSLSRKGKHKAEEKLRNHNIIKKTSQFLIYITMSIEWQGFVEKEVRSKAVRK